MLAVHANVRILHLELLSLSIVDLSIRDGLLIDLLEVVQLLRCCLPQLHGLQPFLYKYTREYTDTLDRHQ